MTEQNVVTLSRFQADLSRSLARRGERLLNADDMAKQVAELEPLEAYFIIKEMGVADAAPLVTCTTQQQLQTFVDLDCWNGDLPDILELDAWLAPFLAEGKPALAEAFQLIDPELQVLFLASSVRLEEHEEQQDHGDPPAGTIRKTTPCGFFIVDVDEDEDEDREVDPHILLEAIYAADMNLGFRLLTAVLWELRSPLEESALEFRKGRLEEIGFPEREHAMKIFAKPVARPAEIAPSTSEPTTLPALYAEPLKDDGLLSRGLQRVTEHDTLNHIEASLLLMVNHAIVAFGESPRDIRHVSEVARRVRDTISLGLEQLLSPDAPHPSIHGDDTAAAASDLLKSWSVFDIFRYGHQATMTLRREADALCEDPVAQSWLDKSETELDDYSQDRFDRAFIKALRKMPPALAGFEPTRPESLKAFASKSAIVDASERLAGIAERIS